MKPPDPIVFFVDRSLGKNKLPGALREAGLQVEIHDVHLPMNAPDRAWLDLAGRNGWVVLSKDQRILKRTLEREALLGAGVAAFFLTAQDLNAQEMAGIFIMALRRMARLLETYRRPFVATISRRSVVRVIVHSGRLTGR